MVPLTSVALIVPVTFKPPVNTPTPVVEIDPVTEILLIKLAVEVTFIPAVAFKLPVFIAGAEKLVNALKVEILPLVALKLSADTELVALISVPVKLVIVALGPEKDPKEETLPVTVILLVILALVPEILGAASLLEAERLVAETLFALTAPIPETSWLLKNRGPVAENIAELTEGKSTVAVVEIFILVPEDKL